MKSLAALLLLLLLPLLCSAQPAIELKPDTVIFGNIPQKAKAYHTIMAYSVGTDTLRIEKIETFNDCMSVKYDKANLPPGDSTAIWVVFSSFLHEGYNIRYPLVKTNITNAFKGEVRITVIPQVIKNPETLFPVHVSPFRLIASQFGDSGKTKFEFAIINESDEYAPLRLIYYDSTYYSLNIPTYVPPNDTVIGYIKLNDLGYYGEFESSFTFEFINEESEPENYTVPIRRRIFRPRK